MTDAFHDVKQPLKKEELIPVTEDSFQQLKSVQPINYSYSELKQIFEDNGLSIDCLYMATKGLYPFWYIDGFLYIPVVSFHPSIFSLQLNGEQVNSQKLKLQQDWDSQKYSSFFAQMDSQFGFDVFFKHYDEISDEQKYTIFKKLYTHNEYGFQDIEPDVIKELFSLNPDTSFQDEIIVEPDGFATLYRGMQDNSASPEEAYSWTLSFETAKYFATRFNATDCSIYQARVRLEDIVDYIDDRGEEEILVLPDTLVDVKDMGFYTFNDEMFQELKDEGVVDVYQENAFNQLKGKWFHKPDGIHGKRHMKRVLFLSLIMSYLDDLSEEDRKILIYASLYHDIGREHDWEDEGHGMQSVLKRRKLNLPTKGLNEEEVKIMEFVMKYHSIRDEVGLRKIETERGIKDKERAIDLFKRFKDCDGLDRVRLGDLDIRYIRTETGKKLMLVAYQLLKNIE